MEFNHITPKLFTRPWFEGRRTTMVSVFKGMYAPKVASYFGYIEFIIDNAFDNKVPLSEVINQIEETLENIREDMKS